MIFLPTNLEAYLTGPSGITNARQFADAIYNDADALAEFEIGDADLPAPIARELDRLIALRNRRNQNGY